MACWQFLKRRLPVLLSATLSSVVAGLDHTKPCGEAAGAGLSCMGCGILTCFQHDMWSIRMQLHAGVSDNRLQNVVITLDKVKLCLERPGESLILPPSLVLPCHGTRQG